MTSGPTDWSKWKVRKLLPKRAKQGGTEPSIRGSAAKSKEREGDQWEFRDMEPSENQLRHLVAAAVGAVLSCVPVPGKSVPATPWRGNRATSHFCTGKGKNEQVG